MDPSGPMDTWGGAWADGAPTFSCDREGAIPWIEANFHDCIYTTKEMISFGLGLASIAVWVLAQMPQLVDNIKNESAEALSVWFLAQVRRTGRSRYPHAWPHAPCAPMCSGSWGTRSIC